MSHQIKKICVVGAGNIGHQISLLAALAGYYVTCTDIDKDILYKAKQFSDNYLPERVAKGKLSKEEAEVASSRLSFTTNLEVAAKESDIVIEAIIEKLESKRKLFAQLNEICSVDAILATNSSYIVSSKIADVVTNRPERVCNIHFFNPALVMKTVEVVKGSHTSDETVKNAIEFCIDIGKIPVLLNKEIYGFIVNRILTAIKKEALYLYDTGVASYEDIDKAVVHALGHPMGPFRLMDLTGIDLTYHVGIERYQATGDPSYKPSPIIVEKYVKKEWGRKIGKGFYNYCT